MKVYTDKQIQGIINEVTNAWRVCSRITPGNAVHISGLIRSYLRMIISDITGKNEEEVDKELYNRYNI